MSGNQHLVNLVKKAHQIVARISLFLSAIRCYKGSCCYKHATEFLRYVQFGRVLTIPDYRDRGTGFQIKLVAVLLKDCSMKWSLGSTEMVSDVLFESTAWIALKIFDSISSFSGDVKVVDNRLGGGMLDVAW